MAIPFEKDSYVFTAIYLDIRLRCHVRVRFECMVDSQGIADSSQIRSNLAHEFATYDDRLLNEWISGCSSSFSHCVLGCYSDEFLRIIFISHMSLFHNLKI